jgi:hypothetical protein
MGLKSRVLAAQDVLLCACRKWWRPLALLGGSFGLIVNVIIIPLWTRTPADLEKAAPYFAAIVAAYWARALEKIKGAAE